MLSVFLTAAVQTIGSEFVLGYIQAMDGERDPRNLLTVFTSVRLIVHSLSFGELYTDTHWVCHINYWLCFIVATAETLVEDLFEVTSCYFPIDFTPVSTAVQ